MTGLMSIKQLNTHFNWINILGLAVYLFFVVLFIFCFKFGPLALIGSFAIKNAVQVLCMLILLRSNSCFYVYYTPICVRKFSSTSARVASLISPSQLLILVLAKRLNEFYLFRIHNLSPNLVTSDPSFFSIV